MNLSSEFGGNILGICQDPTRIGIRAEWSEYGRNMVGMTQSPSKNGSLITKMPFLPYSNQIPTIPLGSARNVWGSVKYSIFLVQGLVVPQAFVASTASNLRLSAFPFGNFWLVFKGPVFAFFGNLLSQSIAIKFPHHNWGFEHFSFFLGFFGSMDRTGPKILCAKTQL